MYAKTQRLYRTKETSVHVEVVFDEAGRLVDIRQTNDADGLISFVSNVSLSCPSCQCQCDVNLLVHDNLAMESTTTEPAANYTISYVKNEVVIQEPPPQEMQQDTKGWALEPSGSLNTSYEEDHAYYSNPIKIEVVQTDDDCDDQEGDSDASTLTAESAGAFETDHDSSETLSEYEEENNQPVVNVKPAVNVQRSKATIVTKVNNNKPKPASPSPSPLAKLRSNSKLPTKGVKGKYGCAYCLATFENLKQLLEHKNKHTLTCSICKPLRTLSNLYALGYHVLQKHRSLRDKMDVQNAKECIKCHNKYFDQSYVRHVKICIGKPPPAQVEEEAEEQKSLGRGRRKKREAKKRKF